MNRRSLVLGTVPLVSGLAGCSAPWDESDESPTLDLTVFNQTDTPYSIELSLFRDNDDATRSEARAFSSRLDVEPDGITEENDIAAVEPYVISYEVFEENSRRTDQDHVHYYPDDGDEDDVQVFDIRPPGYLTRR